MSCSVDSPEILGPIYDGDEVIIGVTYKEGSSTTLGFLYVQPNPVGANENNFFGVSGGSILFTPENVPRFKINFLSEDRSGSNNPYVFFTMANRKEIMDGCPKKGGTCKNGIGNISNSGIGVTSYSAETFIGYPSGPTKESFLYPGPPAPIQLMAADGTTPWFPLTSNPREPLRGDYVLALSNVPYYMNAIVEGRRAEKVNVIASLSTDVIQCTTGPGVTCETKYYIIPTSYFESNSARIKDVSGASLCKACAPASGTSAILGAFCSVGCNPQLNHGQFCCSGKCSEDQIDCTKVCKYGFTDKNECNDNCFYDYCTGGRQCDEDCKSSCPKQTSVCTLTNDTYSCVPLSIPGNGGLTGPQGNNTGLTTTEITTIAVLALFIIGLVIFVIYAWGTAYNKTT